MLICMKMCQQILASKWSIKVCIQMSNLIRRKLNVVVLKIVTHRNNIQMHIYIYIALILEYYQYVLHVSLLYYIILKSILSNFTYNNFNKIAQINLVSDTRTILTSRCVSLSTVWGRLAWLEVLGWYWCSVYILAPRGGGVSSPVAPGRGEESLRKWRALSSTTGRQCETLAQGMKYSTIRWKRAS